MEFPLKFSFKLLAIASQIYVRDANGSLVGYVRQKLLKLKEDINIFTDETQKTLVWNVKADRVLDVSARYSFTDSKGAFLGSIERRGFRSVWKANYEIDDRSGSLLLQVKEENAWIKVIDTVIGEIPLVGAFSGYFFNPSFIVSRADGSPVARLRKRPAFFEGQFDLDLLGPIETWEEDLLILGSLTTILLERGRG